MRTGAGAHVAARLRNLDIGVLSGAGPINLAAAYGITSATPPDPSAPSGSPTDEPDIPRERRSPAWQGGGMRPTAYRRNARGLRDRQAFEGVRMQAGTLFAACHTQAEVANQLGWLAKSSAAGTPAGNPAGCRRCAAPARPGRPRRRGRRAHAQRARRSGWVLPVGVLAGG
jgi:hypothetical protein